MMENKVYPPRVPIIFPDKRGEEAAAQKAHRRMSMVTAPKCDLFSKPTPNIHTRVDTTTLTEDQLKALAQESLVTWSCAVSPKVDGKPFDFDNRRYLIPLYSDDSREIVVKKAAQMGASTYMFLDVIHALNRRPIKAGVFLPTESLISTMAKDRLDPILKENPELIAKGADISKSVKLKHIGQGSLYLLYMGGRASKDSVPLDKITFDEVRLMDYKDVDQALERVSASPHKIIRWLSTPGYPDRDIDRMFQLSTQAYWHSKCRCPDGVNLALEFPNSVMEHKNEVFYICPKCRTKINEPQNGFFVEYNPGHHRKGYAFSQMVSKFMPPEMLWRAYNETTNVREFYNSKLGLAFQDDSNVSIQESEILECVNTDLRWRQPFRETFLGADQMHGLITVVIAAYNRDGKKQIVHVEWIDSYSKEYREFGKEVSPFKRLHKLMKEYNVKRAVIDNLPNTNEALAFARAFPGKVYLALYRNQQDVVAWTDTEKIGQRRASDATKYKYRVMLNRFSSIEFALGAWKTKEVTMPNPRGLVQEVRNTRGEFEPTFMGDLFIKHLMGVIREKKIIDEDTGEFKMRWINKSFDPHLVHAWTYCYFAMERSQPKFNFSVTL